MRVNSLNSLPASSALRPMPVSLTVTVTASPLRLSLTLTEPPSRLYLTAFEMRLLKTISTSPGSARSSTSGPVLERHRDAAALGVDGEQLHRRLGQLAQVQALDDALALAGLDAGEVEQVHDELLHAVHAHDAALDHLQVLVGLGGAQDVQVALHRVERRLELVREHRDEVEADLALLLGQLARLLAQDELAGRLAQRVAQLLRGERLGEEVVGAELGRLDRGLEGRVGRDHDGQDRTALRAHGVEDVHAADARQLEVEQQQVDLAALVQPRQVVLRRW